MNPNSDKMLPAVGCGDLFSSGKGCAKCRELKSLGEFYSDSRSTDGLRPRCKTCMAEDAHMRRNADLEATRSYKREWAANDRQNNPEKARQAQLNYYWKNPEKGRALCKEYRKKNPNRIYEDARKAVANLFDGYVRQTLVRKTTLSPSDIPQELVELQRVHLKLHRTLKAKQP